MILLTGYFLARQVQRWADDTLKRLDFNRMAAAGGLDEVVVRTGSRLDPVRALAKLIFWLVMLVVILLASTALGLESINQMFGTMLAFIPTLIAGIVIVILGMILGEFVRGLILASAGTVSGVPTVAKMAKGAVVVIAVFMALQQVGVAEEIVTAAFTLTLGAVALAVGSRSGWATAISRARSPAGGTRKAGGGTGGAPTARGPTRRRETSRRSWTKADAGGR